VDSQLAYQSAFLQNAVAQNMQIQQQLMLQNQVQLIKIIELEHIMQILYLNV
jgi:hypothetical protein